MTVLVTGAAGFIGSHICEQLLAQNKRVIGVDSFVQSYPRHLKEFNLTHLKTQPGFTFYEMDLRFHDLLEIMVDVEYVIHAAGLPGLDSSREQFDSYVSCNFVATQRLLEAVSTAGIRKLIHISTSSVYGPIAIGNEAQPTQPISLYGVTKLAAENLVLTYAREFDVPAVILRYFSVYGPRQRPDMAYNIFINAMLEGHPITVYGDGRQSRSNTYIDDCVDGTLRALEYGQTGEIYNIGGGEVITLLDAIEVIADAVGVQPVIEHQPARTGDQRHTHADITKAKIALGYSPSTDPEEGLAIQIASYRSLRAATAS